jgi:GTPase SAR1 family protein
LTKENSYKDLDHWVDFIHENASNAKGIIFGNKKDLISERVISRESAEAFATSKGCLYFEGSAKTSEGVRDAFDKMGELVFSPGDKGDEASTLITANGDGTSKCC